MSGVEGTDVATADKAVATADEAVEKATQIRKTNTAKIAKGVVAHEAAECYQHECNVATSPHCWKKEIHGIS